MVGDWTHSSGAITENMVMVTVDICFSAASGGLEHSTAA